MNCMKILQVCQSFYPCLASGGVVQVAYHLSRKLADNGHDVTVYTTDGCIKRHKINIEIKKNNKIRYNNFNLYYFSNLSYFLAVTLKIATPYYLLKMGQELKKFDIIHIHETRTFLAVIVHYYAKIYRIPYVLQPHGDLPVANEKQIVKKIFDLFWGNKIIHDASKIIVLNETEKKHCEYFKVNKDKIEIIPNGINMLEYNNLPERGNFKYRHGIEQDEKVILYLGRLNKSKGIELLVEAFADISKNLNNVKLALVGPDDGYIPSLNDDIMDKVIHTGFVTNDEKFEALVDADVFVTPKFYGFPVTFLESCACGTPIITTNKGDELDWIHENVGYVVGYDKGLLRDAIIRILTDDRLREQFGKNGTIILGKYFRWDEIVRKLETIYGDCINMGKS